MNENITQIIISLISAFGVIYGVYSTIRIKRMDMEMKNIKKENEALVTNGLAIDILMNYSFLNTWKTQVEAIFSQTCADRALMLYAINGKVEFRYANAIVEQHKDNSNIVYSMGAVNKYVNIEIDSHYRTCLKKSEENGVYHYIVEDEPECLLTNLYKAEKVSESIIKFIKRIRIDDNNDVVVYMSIATHEPNSFNEIEETLIKTLVSPIRKESERLKIELLN